MGRYALIQELELKYKHLGEMISFLESDYGGVTQGRLNRLYEALESMKEILDDLNLTLDK